VPMNWQTEVVVFIFKKGDWTVCSNYRDITLLSLQGESLCQGDGKEALTVGQTSDSRLAVWIPSRPWNSGPVLYPRKSTGGVLGVCPTSPHVLCGFREGFGPGPSGVILGSYAGVLGAKLVAMGYAVSVLLQ